MMDYDIDNLRLCINCADRETTSPDGICSNCKEQSMIDDSVPTPFDWSVWDDDDDEIKEPSCAYCGAKAGIIHMHDTEWACSTCWRDEYGEDDELYYGSDE